MTDITLRTILQAIDKANGISKNSSKNEERFFKAQLEIGNKTNIILTVLQGSKTSTTAPSSKNLFDIIPIPNLGPILNAIALAEKVAAVVGKTYEFAKGGAEIGSYQVASTNFAATKNSNIGDIVTSIVDASLGTIDENSARQLASTTMMLGLEANVENYGQLIEAAGIRARVMGISTTEAFTDILQGVNNLSPTMLNNYGIVVDENKAYTQYAATLGKTSRGLTDVEKRQAFLNQVIEESGQIINETGGLDPDAMTGFGRIDAWWTNLTDGIAEDFGSALGNSLLPSDEKQIAYQNQVQAVLNDSTSTYKDYTRAINSAAMAEGGYINSNGDLVRAIYEYNNATGGVVQTGEELLQQNYKLTKSDWARAQALTAQAEAYLNTQQQARFYTETIGEINTNDGNYLAVGLSGGAQSIIDEYLNMMSNAKGSPTGQTAALDQLTQSTNEYTMSLVQMMGEERVSYAGQYELASSFGLLDQNAVNFYGALNILTDKFDENGDGVISSRQEIENWTAGVVEMTDRWNGAVLNDKTATISINYLINGIAEYIPWDFGYKDASGYTWFNPTVKQVTATGTTSGIPRAAGGSVIKGQAYLVGEEGMELFVPDTSGMIIPNNKLGGEYGSSSVGGSYQPILVNIDSPLFIGTNKNEIKRVIGPAVKELVEAERLRNG